MRELYGRIWTDGYSPTIDVEYETGIVTITVTDVNGTTSYEINLSESSISDRSISHEKLVLETITADELADGAVTADKIGSGAVTEGKIGSGAVTKNKIGAGAVTENKIGAGAVTRDKIGNGAVNADKLDVDAGDIPYSNTVSGLSATDVQNAVDELTALKFTNIPVSAWVSDATYADFGYKAVLTCNGITANHFADVVLPPDIALSGSVAPIALTGANSVTIYSSDNTLSFTIPMIFATK